ncbi:MAG: Nif3-like dinuclear metal center hexameric protein, partial [Synergistaceae bacterium]|nr:Nif3-like dinuclear metal center hexameric protein [Synergistaceae bacterium]
MTFASSSRINKIMKVRDLLDAINTFAPFELCEDWDNSGLLVGSYDSE